MTRNPARRVNRISFLKRNKGRFVGCSKYIFFVLFILSSKMESNIAYCFIENLSVPIELKHEQTNMYSNIVLLTYLNYLDAIQNKTVPFICYKYENDWIKCRIVSTDFESIIWRAMILRRKLLVLRAGNP